MASSGSEAPDYDDDFEDASDDDGGMHKSMHGGFRRTGSRKQTAEVEVPVSAAEAPQTPQPSSSAPVEVSTPAAEVSSFSPVATLVEAGGRPGSRPGTNEQARRPGRRRAEEESRQPVAVVPRSATEEALEMNTSQSSFKSSSGRRVVRGKISVGESEPAAQRPGTGDSSGKAAPSRPIWLQSDANAQRQLPRHESPNRGGPLRSSSGDRELNASPPSGRPPRSADPFLGSSGGRGRPPVDPDFDADGRASTADGDRKVKRLQQEIQRLTARLKEAELYSAQDEGLPIFQLEEVEVGCQIAQGGFSSVHNAVWRSTPCALKKIFDPVITEELRSEFENEVKMLRRLRHPNVIIIMAVCRVPPALSILTEFVAGGSLFQLLHGPPQARRPNSIDCEPASLLPVMHQTSAALAYLHAMLVVHRDIKSHNILLTPGRFPVAKLCDFGLARTKSELCTGTMQWAGTPCYMAPELFAKRKYTEAVDIFAFGVMLWETMSTEIPHANMEPADIAHRVTKDGAGLPITHGWPKSLKALLRSSLAVQAEERPSMVSIGEQLQRIIVEFPPPD